MVSFKHELELMFSDFALLGVAIQSKGKHPFHNLDRCLRGSLHGLRRQSRISEVDDVRDALFHLLMQYLAALR
jgi:hypothetical protein